LAEKYLKEQSVEDFGLKIKVSSDTDKAESTQDFKSRAEEMDADHRT